MPHNQPKIKRAFFVGAGLLCLALGFIGMAVPILPTTPFLLLAAYLFLRSSPRLHAWLLGHRLFGPYIIAYQEHKAIPGATRTKALILLWLSLILSAILVQKPWLWALLGVIGLGVSIHLLTLRTLSPGEYRAIARQQAAKDSDLVK